MSKKISRRRFIQQASGSLLGALTVPQILPIPLQAKTGRSSANNRLTLGCIGVGGMGTANLKGFLNHDDLQVLAVCDVDRVHRDKARELVNQMYGNEDCAGYNDYRELLARPDIDMVMIATPDHWHALIAIGAARAGKDIYAEKPLAYSIAEGRVIVDAVQRHGVIWQTGSWQRSQQHFRLACELVRNGRIGNVHTVRVGLPQGNGIQDNGTQPCDPPQGFDYDMWLGPAPWRPYNPSRCHWNFRWISDYSQGQLTDWAGHHCDIANWAMDTELSAPVTIEGQATYPAAKDGLFDTPESYYFECQFKEGFTMIVADSMQQPKGMGVHFIGDEGWIHVNRSGLWAGPEAILKSPIRPNEIQLYRSADHIGNFIDCVRSRRPTITPADVAHYSIMIGHLGSIAMKLGRRLTWDPARERFADDAEANRHLSRPMRSPWNV